VPEGAEHAVTRVDVNQHRQLDLLMLALFGTEERTAEYWTRLLKGADKRLKITEIYYEPQGLCYWRFG
jgi:hypothetical protein